MGKPKRNDKDPARDRCQTPDYAVEPLLPYLYRLQAKLGRQLVVWEPAAGEGLLVGYLQQAGFAVISGDILTGQDYFNPRSEPEQYDVQVTNVPFSRKFGWLKRAYRLGKPFAFLSPSDMLFAGEKAVPLFEQHGIEVLLPYQRIDYKMPNLGWGEGKTKSQAQFHSSWFTWQLGIGKFITYVRILKGKARERAAVQPMLAGMEATS